METKWFPKKCESPKVKEQSRNSCVLPEDIIMANILTRLPVKSIMRFKSVCKPWLQLFSTPDFVKSHRAQFSSDPKNESLFFYESRRRRPGTMSLLNPNSNDKKPTTILHSLNFMDFVGCCNGLICLLEPVRRPYPGHPIHLWNPAMRLVKRLTLEDVARHPGSASLGFGYDAERDDFRVVSIVRERGVEVYSVNSDSWSKIEVGFEFHVERGKNDVIVNGNPYWIAKVDGDDVLLCFDVTRMVFKTEPIPGEISGVCMGGMMDPKLVDLNGALGIIGWNLADDEIPLDIWVFGDGDRIWRKTNSLATIRVVCRILLCLKNGNFVGYRVDGELFVVDPDNGCAEVIAIDDAPNRHFEVFGYTESLTHIDGMIKQVTGRESSSKCLNNLGYG